MPYDALVVLGSGVNQDGILPGHAKQTVKDAADYFKDHIAPIVVFSGGMSFKSDEQPLASEAQAMKDYAVTCGVPSEDIILETESKDTLGNALFTKRSVVIPLGMRTIAVLPGQYHSEERVSYLFRKVYGTDVAVTIVSRSRVDISAEAREARSLAQAHQMIDRVDDGDDQTLYEIIMAHHPGYNKNS